GTAAGGREDADAGTAGCQRRLGSDGGLQCGEVAHVVLVEVAEKVVRGSDGDLAVVQAGVVAGSSGGGAGAGGHSVGIGDVKIDGVAGGSEEEIAEGGVGAGVGKGRADAVNVLGFVHHRREDEALAEQPVGGVGDAAGAGEGGDALKDVAAE